MRPIFDLRPRPDPAATRAKWIFVGFLALAGFLLAAEHRAHLLGVLPWLILLACPLMHLFMHHGHGGHAGHPRTHPENVRTPGEES